MRLLVLSVLLAFTSGCLRDPLGGPEAPGPACPGVDAFWAPSAANGIRFDPRLRSDVIGYFPNASLARIQAAVLPGGWTFDVQEISRSLDNGSLLRVGLQGATGGPAGAVSLNWTTGGVEGCEEVAAFARWTVQSAAPQKYAAPGDGVSAYYAGFWLNGTLFSTNMRSIHDAGWPRAGWYEPSHGPPLNVYVYDRDRTERGPQWAPTDPRTNRAVEWSYAVTIEGFNEGLKGMSASSQRVVVLPPEMAYTQPGRESHRLYGDTLVFFIQVVEVVDVPCPPEAPRRDACRTPA